jgi:D-alanyl-lipoteichoic acid acyltransferase DltB (MBOAT superfamily)
MTFTKLPFVILCLVTYGLWLLARHDYRAKLAVMLAASLFFYGYNQWRLLFLISAYCLADWAVACWIERSRRPGWPLTLGVGFNLILLAFWKYTPMLLRTIAQVASALDLPAPAGPPPWAVPLGISFYALTGIAYMVDVYRGGIPAERNFWRVTVHLIFFPRLMAGPILRPREFLSALHPDRIPDGPEHPQEAMLLLARGYFKKLVLADRIALAVEPFFLHVGDPATDGVWALPYIYLYAFQIYCDFSGYTDIARGLGLMFGFRWPENFRLPYLAGSVEEFWRRWHITLSTFLRDYLFLPLASVWRRRGWRYVALLATLLLGGLWHGASWSFVLWGGLHGAYLLVNRLWIESSLRERLRARAGAAGRVGHLLSIALTFHCVCLGWCFFRLTALSEGLACLRKWFVFDADKLFVGGSRDLSLWVLLGLYGTLAWLAHQAHGRAWLLGREPQADSAPLARGFAWGTSVTLLLLAVLLAPGGETPPFIYFQF